MNDEIIVSVVWSVYNEEKYIGKCIDSLLLQDYPQNSMEWIFVDGRSKDRTVELLEQYQEKYPVLIKILHNLQRIVSCAMDIDREASEGKYIVCLDVYAD